MKITFPHMGNLYIAITGFLEELGVESVIPPKPSKAAINIGTTLSPESACLPLKVNIGDYIQALENGADTILMAGGVGPCRFGYYCEVQKEILKDAGYNFEMIVIEPPCGRPLTLLSKIRKLMGGASWTELYRAGRMAWQKLLAVDEIEKMAHFIRPREIERGSTSVIESKALKLIHSAKTLTELKEASYQGRKAFSALQVQEDRDVLKVGIVGEIYTILEPFVNLNTEQVLGHLGVQIERMIYMSDWVRANIIPDALPFLSSEHKRTAKLAKPYLNHFVGGDGLESIGKSVEYSYRGFDGVIHLFPLTCMPEIVAKSLLPTISSDLDIPITSLVLDEHTGEAGFITRLEAFVDLLRWRKAKGKTVANS